MKVLSYYMDNDDLVLELENGSSTRLVKPYYTSIRYVGLEYDSNESVVLVGNNKFWSKESRKENE